MKFWLDENRNIVEVTVLRHRQHTSDSEVRTRDGQSRLAWTLDIFDSREQAEETKRLRQGLDKWSKQAMRTA